MPWLRIDDGFAEHEKILDLSDRAFRLHVTALCQCAKNLTDGAVDAKRLKIIAAIIGKPVTGSVKELVTAGLWVAGDDGSYAINDYLEYNPSAADARGKREKRQKAGHLGGVASGASKREAKAKASAEPNASSTGVKPRPVPSPPEVLLDQHSGRHSEDASLPESINPENELLVLRLMLRIGDHADEGDNGLPPTAQVVRSLAAKLPPASLNKVIESIDSQHPVDRAAYAVGALQGEVEERNAA